MVGTQFGHVPDVAFEEIKQIRNQQMHQQPASMPFFAPTFGSNTSSPSINSPTTNDSLFISSHQARPTARDIIVHSNPGSTRSRSLAANSVTRPTVVPVSTNANNPTYPTAALPANKQAFSSPTRYNVTRVNASTTINNSVPPGSNLSHNSYASNRSVPTNNASNVKPRAAHYQQPMAVTNTLTNPTTTTTVGDGEQHSHYETTYRSSFVKPLVP